MATAARASSRAAVASAIKLVETVLTPLQFGRDVHSSGTLTGRRRQLVSTAPLPPSIVLRTVACSPSCAMFDAFAWTLLPSRPSVPSFKNPSPRQENGQHEQRLQLLQEPLPKRRDRAVNEIRVRRDNRNAIESHRRLFQFPARHHSRRAAENSIASHLRMVGLRTAAQSTLLQARRSGCFGPPLPRTAPECS